MTAANTYADYMNFLRSWIADPSAVSAVAPSSSALARLITRELVPAHAPVMELGPGTGVFTRAILERGIAEADLTLVEYGSDFARSLESRFPQARVLQMDAARLGQRRLYEDAPLGAVVSGLPMLSFSPRMIMSILSGVFQYMRPGGAFYQFTYGPRCPVPRRILDRLGLKATFIGRAVRNIPPAAVYRISRRRPHPAV